jgi:S1-C subfamily serine protease
MGKVYKLFLFMYVKIMLVTSGIKNPMKNTFFFFILIVLSQSIFSQENYGSIDSKLLKAVVRIECIDLSGGRSTGTGFLVNVQRDSKGKQRMFLVTNKHMIGDYNPCDSFMAAKSINVTFYTKDSAKRFTTFPIPISNGLHIEKNIYLHPNRQVDIAIIEINSVASVQGASITSFDTSILVPLREFGKYRVGVGDHIFAIGYPADIRSITSNLPIAKSGWISSNLDGDVVLQTRWQKRDSTFCAPLLKGKIFLIDGSIIPGNSGGPVLLARDLGHYSGNFLANNDYEPPKNVVLGIVSSGFGSTGINIIYSTDYILEIIAGIL